MMKIVIDANILVSAFVFGGRIKAKLERILNDEQIQVITSPAINAELEDVLFQEKFERFQTKATLEMLLDSFLADALTLFVKSTFTDCRDPKDNKFLDAAVNGQAEYLITGDADLLSLHPFQGVKILTIAEFLQDLDFLEIRG